MSPFSQLQKAKAEMEAKIKASEGRPLPKAFKASNASTPASGAGEPAQLLTGEDDSWPIGKIALGLAVLGTGLLVARKVLG